MDLFAVVGRPIAHSLSPRMHNPAFKAEGIEAVYTRLSSESAAEAMRTAKEMGLKGLNVTSPFKEDFASLVDELDENAETLGAVNTVLFGEESRGFNTDVAGVAKALASNGVEVNGSRALVLGAGGAAKAAALALVNGGANVVVANRTEEKAKRIAEALGCNHCSLREVSGADVIVSAVSTTERIIPADAVGGAVVLDANYASESALVSDARRKGCKVISGKEWLLFQGAGAFELFTGRKAPLEEMRAALSTAPFAPPNIAFIGFMGSGKSAVARAVAGKSGMTLMDLDERIETKAGMPIKKIFETMSEKQFRQMERREVASLSAASDSVIACGGGAVLDDANVAALKRNCLTVWLWASPENVLKRVEGDASRPLFNVPNRDEVARAIIAERLPLYARAADVLVDTRGKTPAGIAELVLDEVSSSFRG